VKLSSFATVGNKSMGRIVSLNRDTQCCFEVDRERIVMSKSFRRLEAKTQVFSSDKGDHFRKRLTHSLEVSHIARRIATGLGLNATLAESIALAHDIGHPPFGHVGERCLDDIMRKRGSRFSHNIQTFKIVTTLERSFVEFDGLNLSWETLDGILKHNGPVSQEEQRNGCFNYVFLYNDIIPEKFRFNLSSCASLEAQVAAIADDIAYVAHDTEDAFRANLLAFEAISKLPIFSPIVEEILSNYPNVETDRCVAAAKHRVIDVMVNDAVQASTKEISRYRIFDSLDATLLDHNVIVPSNVLMNDILKLKNELRMHMYNFGSSKYMVNWVVDLISSTFDHYMFNPESMPEHPWQHRYFKSNDDQERSMVVCDFVAGMTDSFIKNTCQMSMI